MSQVFVNNPFESIASAYPVIKETIPQSALGYHTNNKYPEFPPLMSDGRTVTASWQPEAVANAELIKTSGVQSNWQYRQYLTQHALPIMQHNFREMSNDVGYTLREGDLSKIQSGNIVDYAVSFPYLYSSPSDQTKPLGYQSTDLKQLYLSREELNSRKMAPSIGRL